MAVYGGNHRRVAPAAAGGNGAVRLNNRSASSAASRQSARRRTTLALLSSLLIMILGLVSLSYRVAMHNIDAAEDVTGLRGGYRSGPQPNTPSSKSHSETQNVAVGSSSSSGSAGGLNHDRCAFRSYPSNRLYGLSSKSPSKFLSEAAYIRGRAPFVLNPNENDGRIIPGGTSVEQTRPAKVCIDTTSWDDLKGENGEERLPFTDGHNPSVISLASNPYTLGSESDNQQQRQQHGRLDPTHLEAISSLFPSMPLDSLFLGVTCFGSGQCKFGLSPKEVDEYKFSSHDEPPGGKRAVIAVLAPHDDGSHSPFETIAQSTLLLERDANYGSMRRRALKAEREDGGGYSRVQLEFDDPRLFFHLGRVWVLYRNGPLFGYNAQVHNPIHFERRSSSPEGEGSSGIEKFVAYVKASEAVRIDGGRNIALISEEPILGGDGGGVVEWVSNPTLKALTWVDPVTVRDDINLADVEAKLLKSRRRLSEVESETRHSTESRRRLGSKPSKSHIHGTNGYMVPLPSTGELIGVAHFHRPEDRKPSEFALHGHHYTHAFFTVARLSHPGGDFKLKRISNEFVFRANSIQAGQARPFDDGDVIQFASGVDLVGNDISGRLLISYGINDCEGGVFTLAMEKVQSMLIEVEQGQEVVDLMEYMF